MQLTMNYGRENLELDVPDNWDTVLIEKKPMPLLDNPADAFAGALANPVGCPPISELVRDKQTVCILICDKYVPLPARQSAYPRPFKIPHCAYKASAYNKCC